MIKPSEVGFDGQGITPAVQVHGWIDSFKYDSVDRVTKYLSKILNIPIKILKVGKLLIIKLDKNINIIQILVIQKHQIIYHV